MTRGWATSVTTVEHLFIKSLKAVKERTGVMGANGIPAAMGLTAIMAAEFIATSSLKVLENIAIEVFEVFGSGATVDQDGIEF